MSYSSTKTKQQFERLQFKGEMSQMALAKAIEACKSASDLAASVARDYGKAILTKGHPSVTITEYIKAVKIAHHYDSVLDLARHTENQLRRIVK